MKYMLFILKYKGLLLIFKGIHNLLKITSFNF